MSESVEKWLLEALKEHGPVNRRNLTQNRQQDEVVARTMETFPETRGDKKSLIESAVTRLIEDDRIYEIREGRKVLLTTKRPMHDLGQKMRKKLKKTD